MSGFPTTGGGGTAAVLPQPAPVGGNTTGGLFTWTSTQAAGSAVVLSVDGANSALGGNANSDSLSFYGTAGDTQPIAQFFSSKTNQTVFAPGFFLGPGGSTGPDTCFVRSGVSKASLCSAAVGTTGNATLQAGTDSSQVATITTPTATNGGAAVQVSTVDDAMVYLQVGTAGTAFTLSIGHTSAASDVAIMSGAVATSGQLITFRLPAGWFFKWSATTATLTQQKAVQC